MSFTPPTVKQNPYLADLTPREACADLPIRLGLSFDIFDRELYDSCWTNVGRDDIDASIAGIPMKGYQELTEKCYDLIAPMDTFHLISGIRVNFGEDGKSAQITAMSLVPHAPPNTGLDPLGKYFMSGAIHDFRAILNDDGKWRLNGWHLKLQYIQGNAEIMPNLPGEGSLLGNA